MMLFDLIFGTLRLWQRDGVFSTHDIHPARVAQ